MLLDIGQAATRKGVSRGTLQRWMNKGKLGWVIDPTDGRRHLVDADELDAVYTGRGVKVRVVCPRCNHVFPYREFVVKEREGA